MSQFVMDMNQRRLSRDPHYVNRAVAEGRPDATTDATGARVVPVEPPYNQPAPPLEVSDQGDAWLEAAGLDDTPDPEPTPEPEQPEDRKAPELDKGKAPEAEKAPIGEDATPSPAVKSEAEVTGMKHADLVQYAVDHGVDEAGTKAQIVERLRAAGKVGA